MNFRLYHQIKNFKVLVGITIIILALFNFFKIDYENKFIYIIKLSEEAQSPLINNHGVNVDNPNLEFFKKITDKLYYYQNISSKSYNIEFENNNSAIEDIHPKLEQKFYNPFEQKIINIQKNDKRELLNDEIPYNNPIKQKIIDLQKNYGRELTKDEISKIHPDKIFSSFIQLKSKIKIDRAMSNNPNIESFIEIQDQYFLNNLILLILLIFISFVFIFIILRKK